MVFRMLCTADYVPPPPRPAEIPISSSPKPADLGCFSDDAAPVSSPPSSPPCFPWELKQSENPVTEAEVTTSTAEIVKPKLINAFSILGKRKPLSTLSNNDDSNKRPRRSNDSRKPESAQLQIDVGQKVLTKCGQCGMEWNLSSKEDRSLHNKFHLQYSMGPLVNRTFVESTFPGYLFTTKNIEDNIVCVQYPDNKKRLACAELRLQWVECQLGAAPIPLKDRWSMGHQENGEPDPLRDLLKSRFIAVMYVRKCRMAGFLLLERITGAYRVLEPEKRSVIAPSAFTTAATTGGNSAASALRARKEKIAQQSTHSPDQPIKLSKERVQASLGVSRIWVAPAHRQERIAYQMMCAGMQAYHDREEQPNSRLEREQVAFSQPTELGAKFARRWTGKEHGWLVYTD